MAMIRILRRRCKRCGQKKPNSRKCWDFTKDTPEQLNLVCLRCEHKDAFTERRRAERRAYYWANRERVLLNNANRRRAKLQAKLNGLHRVEEMA